MSTLMSQARNRVPRFAEAAVERARLSVVPRVAGRARRTPFAVLVLAILAAGVVGLLMFNTHMQQSSFYATSLQNRADALTARRQALDMELEQLRDPQRLAEAGKKLGMVAPQNPAFVRLADGTVLGTPAAATADDSMRINPFPAPRPDNLSPPPLVVRVVAKPGTADTAAPPSTTSADPRSLAGRKTGTPSGNTPNNTGAAR